MNKENLEAKVVEGVEVLKETFQSIALNLAKLLADEQMLLPNQFTPKQLILEKYKQLIETELDGTESKIKSGTLAIVNACLDSSEDGELPQEMLQVIPKLYDLADLIAFRKEFFIYALSQNKTLQEIAFITDAELEKMYLAAKNLYDQKRYQEAAASFSFLTMINTENSSFWLARGNSEFHMQNYEAALIAYAFVSRVDPDDFYCHIFSCRAYEALEQYENALNALEVALYVLGDNVEEKELQLTLELQIKRLELALHKKGATL
jgi:tetratricopeptide (TPR) repeat protein